MRGGAQESVNDAGEAERKATEDGGFGTVAWVNVSTAVRPGPAGPVAATCTTYVRPRVNPDSVSDVDGPAGVHGVQPDTDPVRRKR